MSPRPDRRPDSRPDRAPRRPAGASGGRAGARPAGASFRPGGSTRPRWGRPEGGSADTPGDRPRYGREGGNRFSSDRAAGDRPGGDRERPTGEWTPRERRGGESSGPPARFDRSAPRPSLPRRGEEGGRFEARPTDRRPADRRPTDRRPADRRTSEPRFSDRRPADRPSTDRRPSDRRPLERRPAEGGAADRRPRPMAGRVGGPRVGGGRPVLFRPAGRGEARPDFGAPPRRPDRDQFRGEAGASPESDTFAAAAPSDLIWGRHSAQATLESGRPIHRIWCTPELRFSPKFLQLLRDAKASGVLVEEVTWARLGQISGGAVHQGIVLQPAAAETLDLATLIDGCRELDESPLLLAVDGLTDPQNLGAIVRSAEALGAHGMVLPQRRNAGLTGSVAKVAAGALEHLPVARVVNLNRSLETLKDEGYRVIGLAEEGNVSLEEVDLEGPLVIVTGSEGDGLSMLTRRNCDQLVRIPLRGATPSLNASVATALLLYEIARRGWMRGLRGTSPAPRLVRPSLPAPAMQEQPDGMTDSATAAVALVEVPSPRVSAAASQPEDANAEEFTAAELVAEAQLAEALQEEALLEEELLDEEGLELPEMGDIEPTLAADWREQTAIADHSVIGDDPAAAAVSAPEADSAQAAPAEAAAAQALLLPEPETAQAHQPQAEPQSLSSSGTDLFAATTSAEMASADTASGEAPLQGSASVVAEAAQAQPRATDDIQDDGATSFEADIAL